ncbi:MAG: hypothetical protein AAFN77_19090, partial [Planctomycetota bacterium]
SVMTLRCIKLSHIWSQTFDRMLKEIVPVDELSKTQTTHGVYRVRRRMNRIAPNLLYEFSSDGPEKYNRNKSNLNNDILLHLLENYTLDTIKSTLQARCGISGTGLNGRYPSPRIHDVGVAYCIWDTIGMDIVKQLSTDSTTVPNPLDFNLNRVRYLATCIPSIRDLAVRVEVAFSKEDFELSQSELEWREPIASKRVKLAVEGAITMMRDSRSDGKLLEVLLDSGKTLDQWFSCDRLVRHMAQIRYWGIDEIKTNRFFGLEG